MILTHRCSLQEQSGIEPSRTSCQCISAADEITFTVWYRRSWCSTSIRVYLASSCVIRSEIAVRSACVSRQRPCGVFFHGKTSDLSTCFISQPRCSGSVQCVTLSVRLSHLLGGCMVCPCQTAICFLICDSLSRQHCYFPVAFLYLNNIWTPVCLLKPTLCIVSWVVRLRTIATSLLTNIILVNLVYRATFCCPLYLFTKKTCGD